ncbi:hypothetical protein TcYC6_0127210 [Trypanosoma cruzi]|nr:hypothetical protein TcYC6_0127210 [Trypanosoma cruzi]RNC55742.1 hypothetical protein TcCL_ESM06733 [Trypanosoma cruzi]
MPYSCRGAALPGCGGEWGPDTEQLPRHRGAKRTADASNQKGSHGVLGRPASASGRGRQQRGAVGIAVWLKNFCFFPIVVRDGGNSAFTKGEPQEHSAVWNNQWTSVPVKATTTARMAAEGAAALFNSAFDVNFVGLLCGGRWEVEGIWTEFI